MTVTKNDVTTTMMGMAAQAYLDMHPRAGKEKAWAWAKLPRNHTRFRERAIDFLTMLEIDRQTKREAQDQIN